MLCVDHHPTIGTIKQILKEQLQYFANAFGFRIGDDTVELFWVWRKAALSSAAPLNLAAKLSVIIWFSALVNENNHKEPNSCVSLSEIFNASGLELMEQFFDECRQILCQIAQHEHTSAIQHKLNLAESQYAKLNAVLSAVGSEQQFIFTAGKHIFLLNNSKGTPIQWEMLKSSQTLPKCIKTREKYSEAFFTYFKHSLIDALPKSLAMTALSTVQMATTSFNNPHSQNSSLLERTLWKITKLHKQNCSDHSPDKPILQMTNITLMKDVYQKENVTHVELQPKVESNRQLEEILNTLSEKDRGKFNTLFLESKNPEFEPSLEYFKKIASLVIDLDLKACSTFVSLINQVLDRKLHENDFHYRNVKRMLLAQIHEKAKNVQRNCIVAYKSELLEIFTIEIQKISTQFCAQSEAKNVCLCFRAIFHLVFGKHQELLNSNMQSDKLELIMACACYAAFKICDNDRPLKQIIAHFKVQNRI